MIDDDVLRFTVSLASANSEFEYINAISRVAEKIGFRYFVYSNYKSMAKLDETPSSDVTITNLPTKLVEDYNAQKLIKIDPTMRPILRGADRHVWKIEDLQAESGSPEAKMVASARDLEIDGGAIVSFVQSKLGFAFMSWIADTASGASRADLEGRLSTISLLSELVHFRVAQSFVPKALFDRQGVKKKNLSPRELEVLKWIAKGKTAWEISVILSISRKTVELHGSNAMKKLGANNRTQAVAHALVLGEISSPEFVSW